MIFSKNHSRFFWSIPLLTVWTLATSLQSCSLPKPSKNFPNELAGQGAFFIDQASGQVVASETYEKIDLPKSRSLSYRACAKDRKARTPIVNQTFEIQNHERKVIATAMTDNAGCLTWSEVLEFSIFKPSHNIIQERNLVTQGRFTGQAQVRFVVNPWTTRVFSEIETNIHAENIQPLRLEALQKLPNAAILRVYPSRSLFTINQVKNNQASYKLDFMGTLALENRDHLNQVFQIPINRAKFKSRVTILNRRKDGKYYLIHRTDWSGYQDLKEALLNIETVYQSNTAACPNGRLDVALEVDISNGIYELKPFEMIFQGPNCQANGFVLMVPFSGYVDAISTHQFSNLEQYLAQNVQATIPQHLKGGGDVSYVRPLEFHTSNVDSQKFTRSKTVRVHTCLSSVIDHDVFKREPLEITTHDGKSQTIHTDDEGCFSWNEVFTHNYFEPQCWKQGQIRIQSKSSDIDFRIPIAFSAVSNHDIYRDLRYFDLPEAQRCKRLNQSDKLGEIFTPKVNLEKTNYEYFVDSYLNIKLKKNVILQMNPFFRRLSLLNSSGIQNDDLPPGEYELTLAVTDNQLKLTSASFDITSIYSFSRHILKIQAGSLISEEIGILMDELKPMGNTTQIVLSLRPRDESTLKWLKPVVFYGPLIFQNVSEFANLKPIYDESLMNKLESTWNQRLKVFSEKNKSKAGVHNFAKENKLSVISLNGEPELRRFWAKLNTNPLLAQPQTYSDHATKGDSNSPSRPMMSYDDFLAWFNNTKGFEIKPSHTVALCRFWLGQIATKPLPNKKSGIFHFHSLSELAGAIHRCQSQIRKEGFSRFFDVQSLLFAEQPQLVKVQSAQFREIGVGQNFSANRSISDTVTKMINWDANLGLKMPEIPGLNLVNASTGVRFSVSRAWANAEAHNMFEAISSGITLISENLYARIRSPKATRCLSIRLNPTLFAPESTWLGERPSYWFQKLNPKLTASEKEHYAQSGLLLCQEQKGEVEFVETYSIFNQRFNIGTLVDPYSDLARPFFVTLRGEKEYLRFLTFIVGKLKIPAGFEGDYTRSGFRENDLKELFTSGHMVSPGVTQSQIITK